MGTYISVLRESYPPKPQFSVEDIPDLSGKVALVTGATSGIGKEIAKGLLSHNAKVYVGARDKTKVEKAIQDLKSETGKEGIWLELDLADLHSVKKAAEEFQRKEKHLRILFNNAGVMEPPIDKVTAQGYDLQFGTNVLGHFYFTKLLLPTLLETSKATPDWKPRIINTSSVVSILADPLNFNTFKDGPARKKQSPRWLYKQSKLAHAMVAQELATRYGDQGLIAASLNPGNIRTDIRRYYNPIKEGIQGRNPLAVHIASHAVPTFTWSAHTFVGCDVGRGGEYEWEVPYPVGALRHTEPHRSRRPGTEGALDLARRTSRQDRWVIRPLPSPERQSTTDTLRTPVLLARSNIPNCHNNGLHRIPHALTRCAKANHTSASPQ